MWPERDESYFPWSLLAFEEPCSRKRVIFLIGTASRQNFASEASGVLSLTSFWIHSRSILARQKQKLSVNLQKISHLFVQCSTKSGLPTNLSTSSSRLARAGRLSSRKDCTVSGVGVDRSDPVKPYEETPNAAKLRRKDLHAFHLPAANRSISLFAGGSSQASLYSS